jgi:hypothetical protein
MSATRALETAREVGIEIGLDGADLLLTAASKPPADVLDALLHHKAEIIVLLRADKDNWSAEDWRSYFDERAGIAEFDGGLPRIHAEAQAFECCVAEWLNRNFVPSAPGRCAVCGGHQGPDRLLPFGTSVTGHAWLHPRCWSAWDARRRAEAIAALAAIIDNPAAGVAAPKAIIPDNKGNLPWCML